MRIIKNKKAKHYALATVAIVGLVGVLGLLMLFMGKSGPAMYVLGGATGAVPVKVYDVSQASVVGEVDTTAGSCTYVANGQLICPGYPSANTQLCLETATDSCGGDDACILDTTQACVDLFGSEAITPESTAVQVGDIVIIKTTLVHGDTSLKTIIGKGEPNPNFSCVFTESFTRVVMLGQGGVGLAGKVFLSHSLPPGTILGPVDHILISGKTHCSGFHLLAGEVISIPGQ